MKYGTKSEYQNEVVDHADFEMVDNKGRKIGTFARKVEVVYTEITEEDKKDRPYLLGFVNKPVGVRYAYSLHATRDGKRYGAIQADVEFATVAERDAALAKAIERSRKNYAKKF